MKLFALPLVALAMWISATAQTPDPVANQAAAPDATAKDAAAKDAAATDAKEQFELGQAVSESAASPIDLVHVLEQHLKKYPDTQKRAAIEQALAKSAMDLNDSARILLYGESVLARETPEDLQLIDRVVRTLVEKEDPERARKALEYVKRYKATIVTLRDKAPPGHLTRGQWSQELDRANARALALEARATGYAGDPEAAAKIAAQSWAATPAGEGAREAGFWLARLGRNAEAIEAYANAFTLEDTRSTEADRASDRARLGDLYSKMNGSEKGLGDVILQAYDRTSALLNERRAALRAKDPNAQATTIADFILPAVGDSAPPLPLASLKGKTVVMDFWATWCAPCRAQQPLIENVKKRFDSSSDIVFLPVDADDDQSLVAPFLKDQGWKTPGYFDAGISRLLAIASIPTVIVLDPSGQISARITGFIPERFEEMLTQRIEEARKTAAR
jgi:thiol-disulfide isomerase/thioredoxin